MYNPSIYLHFFCFLVLFFCVNKINFYCQFIIWRFFYRLLVIIVRSFKKYDQKNVAKCILSISACNKKNCCSFKNDGFWLAQIFVCVLCAVVLLTNRVHWFHEKIVDCWYVHYVLSLLIFISKYVFEILWSGAKEMG